MLNVEELAKELHEAGREAVEQGATVDAEKFGEQTRVFLGWDEVSEQVREGRRIQARYLLNKYAFIDNKMFTICDNDMFLPAVPLHVGDKFIINGTVATITDAGNAAVIETKNWNVYLSLIEKK